MSQVLDTVVAIALCGKPGPSAVLWLGAQLLELQPCPAQALGEKLFIAVGMACVV